MRVLDRKLLRDLWRLRGQVAAMSMVVASGVAVLIMFLSALEALDDTAAAYYERYRFAQVFATVKRAPERLRTRIAAIPGVQWAETRVVKFATIDVAGFEEPIMGQVVSIDPHNASDLNRLVIRAGRRVTPKNPSEVIVNEPFAKAHKLNLGDRLTALLNGKRRVLTVVGIALSPEFVYAIGPGTLMPDKKRYAILWMDRDVLAAAFNLESAFNDVALSLSRGTDPQGVIDRLDNILARYGGIGAYPRADQISNWFLMNEIKQLRSMARVLPTVFLAVAAFLANMVLARLIAVERGEIGLLKAFGYSSWGVGWHYAKLVLAMTLLGIAIGWVIGYWLGYTITRTYADFFNFPFLLYRPSAWPFAAAALVSLGATLAGAAGAVRRAAKQPPAEAMRPPAPPAYHNGWLGRSGLAHDGIGRWLDQPTRIILRQVARWPGRSFLTSMGIGVSIALLIVSLQWLDAINHMVRVYFNEAQHQDITVVLDEARSTRIVGGFKRLPGVMAVEPVRTVRVRFRHGHRSHRESIFGIRPDARLAPVYDAGGTVIPVPEDGLLMSTKLAEVLGVRSGDTVTVEVLEGRRPVRRIPVAALFETYIGTPAYMNAGAVHRMMRERPVANLVYMRVDPRQHSALYRALKSIPVVTGSILRKAAVDLFNQTMAETLWISISFFITFACIMAFGVVYNSARIALSERGRELATLRVIGFTKLEIGYILLGEIAMITLVALPIGCVLGRLLAGMIVGDLETELFRVPLAIEAFTYGISITIGLAATVVSAAVVSRRLDRLDLIAVLKTRE
ncbi:MAG: ABC transporter permease [Alphaproteobacteria bacterium]|nr:ABC transporter permease [Alphaproteobacteria bacterium]